MQKLQETQESLFGEIKVLLQKISSFSTEEELVSHVNVFNELQEKVISLKNYKEINELLSNEESSSQNIERQAINFEIDTKEIQDLEQKPVEISEEVEDLEETIAEEIPVEENVVDEKLDEEYFIEKESQQQDLEAVIEKEKEEEIAEISSAKEEAEQKEEEQRLHEERVKIVDIPAPKHLEEEPQNHEHHENLQEKIEEIHEERLEHHDKKFKLANIKGIKSTVQSLFDDDPLEKIETSASHSFTEEIPTSSLVKSNVPTDYMEAEKTLPDFKLDINDKLAFTKMLFEGSQAELNDVVKKLNSYKTLEEAKEYLSEVYYEKNWQNADEYAQRLWSLVENKFL